MGSFASVARMALLRRSIAAAGAKRMPAGFDIVNFHEMFFLDNLSSG